MKFSEQKLVKYMYSDIKILKIYLQIICYVDLVVQICMYTEQK